MKLQCLLFIFVQGGLQQAEGVNQSWGKAALFSWRPSEPRALLQVPIQVKLLLGLFTDQLSLPGMRIQTPTVLVTETDSVKQQEVGWSLRELHTLQMSLGMSRRTSIQSWSPPWRRKESGMKEVRRDTCLFDWATSIFLSSISMAWRHKWLFFK